MDNKATGALDLNRHLIGPDPCTDQGATTGNSIADDTLHGADSIAEFLYGDKIYRRKIYHLVETSRMPVFRLGSRICARRSVLLRWIAEQEKRGTWL